MLQPEEIKEISLNLLLRFDRMCRDHGIRYSLGMGTLLGAVRHQGFIPWDDDVDLILTRPEYEKLMQLPETRIPDGCALVSIERCPDFSAPLAKFIDTSTVLRQTDHAEQMPLGVYLDLFVYDGLPENAGRRASVCRIGDALQRVWTASELKARPGEKNILKLAYKTLAQRFGFARKIAFLLRRYAKHTPFERASHAACLYFNPFPRARFGFPKEAMERFGDVTFENNRFPAFEDTDLFLSAWYGDYMTPPPPDKRQGHHRYEAYLIE